MERAQPERIRHSMCRCRLVHFSNAVVRLARSGSSQYSQFPRLGWTHWAKVFTASMYTPMRSYCISPPQYSVAEILHRTTPKSVIPWSLDATICRQMTSSMFAARDGTPLASNASKAVRRPRLSKHPRAFLALLLLQLHLSTNGPFPGCVLSW